MAILIVTLIVDTSVIKIYYFSFSQSPLAWRIITFIIICCIYWPGVYLISKFAKDRSKKIRSRPVLRINALHKLLMVSQYMLTGLIAFLVFQIIVFSGYSATLLISATWISYTIAIIMMTVLAARFFSWFRSNRNSVVLLYGLASTTLAINAAFTVVFVSVILMN